MAPIFAPPVPPVPGSSGASSSSLSSSDRSLSSILLSEVFLLRSDFRSEDPSAGLHIGTDGLAGTSD